ncbi:MAG: hypothetical protein LBL21_02770, partial [Rickettsiales bacterium]|nr:hypothetical protein [Rickettsiales bacterium]
MRKVLLFLLAAALPCDAMLRAAAQGDGGRSAAQSPRIAAAAPTSRAAQADATPRGAQSETASRTAQSAESVKSRAAATSAVQKTARPAVANANAAATASARTTSQRTGAAPASRTRAAAAGAIRTAPATRQSGARARAATTTSASRARAAAEGAVEAAAPTVSTRTGAAYEKCKSAYFTCMDQFCAVKNEKYRRCSCSDKIFELDEQQKVLESAADQINDFNAGLDAVGKTAAQAGAMKSASEGELAMGEDNSSGKRLLNAIMSSISGSGETKVAGGALEKLNSVSFDNKSGLFSNDANGQQLAAYNGGTLYTAIYGQCRDVVRENCTDDALQRAVTAYLMAVENDCGTVSKMIADNRKKMTAAAKESGAMLELARVENRQNHNSSDATECLNAVESAIKDEQVCGENYKKCLDNGEFIDKETGKPFSGVKNFYELSSLLSFDSDAALGDQKLTQNPENRQFVANFVQRNKKFAEPALDKCAEIADDVWRDYLDKALLDIHYSQQAKVEEIKRGCMDFVRECYVSNKKSITDFMQNLINPSSMALQPGQIQLTSDLCDDYVQSCNLMFDSNIVSNYVSAVDDKDILTTCRNIAKECFISYGGDKYSNFYNPASGLFPTAQAFDWFTLYGTAPKSKNKNDIVSPCAKKLAEIPECSSSEELLEKIFGGFDKLTSEDDSSCFYYGLLKTGMSTIPTGACTDILNYLNPSNFRQTGVATEIYNEVVGALQQRCRNMNGYFLEYRYLDYKTYCVQNNTQCASMDEAGHIAEYNHAVDEYNNTTPPPLTKKEQYEDKFLTNTFSTVKISPCVATFRTSNAYSNIADDYKFPYFEDICPASYANTVDINSWGICSCWANGGRRVKS